MKNFIPNFRRFRLLAIVFSLICSAAASAWAQAPTITDFTATAAISSTIIIDGTNLSGATSVQFGSVSAVPSSASSTQIQVVVPKGATIGNLTVYTPGGSATTTTAFTPFVIWIGGASGNWDMASNWSDNEVPSQTTNVVINSGKPVVNNSAFCNNLSNNSGLQLDAGADLRITGIFQNLSTFTQTGGRIIFAAPNGIQQIPALNYHDVQISGNGEKQLLGNTTINGTLTFVSSNLTTVDPVNTTLTLNGTISGEKVGSSYIGKLVKSRTVSGVVTDTFGNIGISFTNAGGGNWGNVVATRVTGTAIVNGTYQSIKRYWDITPANPTTNTEVQLSLTWFDSENNGLAFPSNKAQAYRSEDGGASWIMVDAPQTIATSGNERTITVETYNFSKWGVSDDNNPLPVSWLYFNGKATAQGNLLNWATASEKNAAEFIVERSANGRNFEAIGTVKAAGNSNQVLTYSFIDAKSAQERMYYRLKQTDFDGSFSYSAIIVISGAAKGRVAEAGVYPNPFAGTLNLKLQAADGIYEARLISLDGKEVYRQSVSSEANVTLNALPALKPGLYLLQLHGANGVTTLKVTRQ